MMKKIRWGILATGGIAHKFASDLKLVKDAELTAVASRNLEKSKEFARKFNIKNAYGSYEELAHSGDVDVVYIATPHTLHYANTLLCLENGKHVLVEKPAGMNSRQLNDMISLASQKNLFFMEAFWTRFIPSYLKFRELALDGTIGQIQYIQADFGFIGSTDPNHRLQNKSLGGGSLLDIGIYPVFLSLDIAGNPDEILSTAIINKVGIDETTSILFNYRENRINSNLYSTIVANTPVEATVFGNKGSVTLKRMWHIPTKVSLNLTNGKTKKYSFPEKGFGYEYEAREVNKCILEGRMFSEIFPPSASQLLHSTLDEIRQKIGLVYEADTI